jgi:hypothetical protein
VSDRQEGRNIQFDARQVYQEGAMPGGFLGLLVAPVLPAVVGRGDNPMFTAAFRLTPDLSEVAERSRGLE